MKKRKKKTKKKIKEKIILKNKTESFLINMVLLYLIFGMAIMPVTVSYFVDVETSEDNNFTAGSLEFSLRDTSNNIVEADLIDENINPGDITNNKVIVKDEGTTPFEYNIQMNKTGGSDTACNALKVKLEQDGTGVYDNSLSNLNTLTLNISGSQDEIEFNIYLEGNDSDLQNKSCQFDLDFNANQITAGGGFSNEVKITSNEVKTGWWIDPDVEVLSPNGGEVWLLSSTHDITWNANSTDSSATAGMKIDIYLSTDSGATYPTQLVNDTDNDGSFSWTISVKSTTMKIKIKAEDEHGLSNSDESDAIFDPTETPDESAAATTSLEEEKVEASSDQTSVPESSEASSEN